MQVFQRLKVSLPNAVEKVKPIIGDVLQENLGLKSSDEEILINQVSVVFHLAATTSFVENLKFAVDLNVGATQKVLNLCKKIKNLKALVHLSTTFCSADIDEFKEKIYDSPVEPENIISFTNSMKPEVVDAATEMLIRPHPNTYTFTKRLAETLVANSYKDIKIAIVRPSIGKSHCSFCTFYFKYIL